MTYLLRGGEVIFYLELDRGTEPGRRVGDKLRRYPTALANDEKRGLVNVLLVCRSAGRLANLARHAPAGPPWFWGTTDEQRYRLLRGGEERDGDRRNSPVSIIGIPQLVSVGPAT